MALLYDSVIRCVAGCWSETLVDTGPTTLDLPMRMCKGLQSEAHPLRKTPAFMRE
jgi:hypothetical protein